MERHRPELPQAPPRAMVPSRHEFQEVQGQEGGYEPDGHHRAHGRYARVPCPLFFRRGALSVKANEDTVLKDMELSTTQFILKTFINIKPLSWDGLFQTFGYTNNLLFKVGKPDDRHNIK